MTKTRMRGFFYVCCLSLTAYQLTVSLIRRLSFLRASAVLSGGLWQKDKKKPA
jgi:hypothetical protein